MAVLESTDCTQRLRVRLGVLARRSRRHASVGYDPKIKCAVNSSQPQKIYVKPDKKTLHSRVLRYIFISRDASKIFDPDVKARQDARHQRGTDGDGV